MNNKELERWLSLSEHAELMSDGFVRYGPMTCQVQYQQSDRRLLEALLNEFSGRLETAIAENNVLRDHLIEWSNGYVRCLACGHWTHGGQDIPHNFNCVMRGYTKREACGKAVLHGDPASSRLGPGESDG